jgi:O-antigen/teichoic acid export membrane protein
MRTKVVVALLVAGASLGIGLALSHPSLAGMVALVTVSRILLLGVGVPLRATHRVGRAAVVVLVEKASWLAGFALLSAVPVGPLPAFWWSMAISTVIATAVGLALSGGARAFLGGVRLRSPWPGEAGYGTFSLAVSLSLLDVALLGLAGGSAPAGVYGALSRWTQPVLLLSQTFSAAATPFIAGARSSSAAFRTIRGSLWIPALGFAVCLGMVALAPVAVPLLLGPAYRGAAPTLAILAAGAAAVVVCQPLATFLQARGHARLVGRSTMVTVLLQLGGVWLTAGSLGATGAALAYATSQVLLLLVLAAGCAALIPARRRSRDDLGARQESRPCSMA